VWGRAPSPVWGSELATVFSNPRAFRINPHDYFVLAAGGATDDDVVVSGAAGAVPHADRGGGGGWG